MNLVSRIEQQFRESIETKEKSMAEMAAPIAAAVDALLFCLSNNNKILACGNGGSAADAQHFAAELVGRFERERLPLAAIALTTDTSILTAVANDYSYDEVFAKQVLALGQTGDVLLAISTSGNSESICRAVDAAHEREMRVVVLSGKGGGRLAGQLNEDDVALIVPHDRTCRIQEVHLTVVHCLCDGIDIGLLGEPI
jgi:D-sedoheptulose 7-phosphate isomerase